MGKKLGVLYGIPGLMPQIRAQIEERYPDIELVELCDGVVHYDELTVGEVPRVSKRIEEDARYFEEIGCEAMLVTFSAFYNSVVASRGAVNIPVFAIQEPMVEDSLNAGKNIAILRTHGVVNDPTVELLRRRAKEAGKAINIDLILAEGVFDAQKAGNTELANALMKEAAQKASEGHDVIVLLQASMQPFVGVIGDIGKPVLNSVKSGIEQMKCVFDRM